MRLYLAPALLMVLLACTGAICAQDHEGPSIAVREMRHDLGKVKQGTPASHEFEIRNSGNGTLIIDKVLAG